MEIRQLGPDDYLVLNEFADSVERGPHFSWDKQSLLEGLKKWEIWAGFENQIIAVALAGTASGDQMELLWIQTRPSLRNQGKARQLMVRWLNSARRNFEQVFLEVHAGNLAAQSLYESLGFFRLAERKKYYSDGSKAFIFCLNLSK
ncbi:MAG: GNAT family N-acetyltransferase [Bdellovibrionales bacterium]